MKGKVSSRHGPGCQRGAILFWVLAAVPTIFLVGTLAVDIAYIKYNQQRLNSLVEAATLAAGQDLWSENQTTVKATIGTYAAQWGTAATCTSPSVRVSEDSSGGGGGAGNPNVLSANVAVRGPCVTFRDLTSVALPANRAASGANALTVTQRASVPLFFLPDWFGPVEIRATATASAGGGGAPPLNVMLVVDTTQSMDAEDRNCPRNTNGSYQTRLQCALSGARSFVHQLLARGNYTGLIIYPPLASATAVSHQICGSVASGDIQKHMAGDICNPWQDNATSKSTVIPLTSSSDYAQDGLLKPTHDLTKALGGVSGCGLEAQGGKGTYFAQAVRQARYLLLQQSAVNGQQNVLIILTDGDAGSDFITTPTTTITGTINGSTASKSGRKMTVTAMASGCFQLATGQSLSSGTTITNMYPNKGCPDATTQCTGRGRLGTYQVLDSLKLTSRTITVTPQTYSSNQCQQAIVAANEAKADGIWVYVIAYNALTGGYNASTPSNRSCPEDQSTLSPLSSGVGVSACKTLQWMAGDAAATSYPGATSPYFFSTSSSCSSVNGYSDLETVFGLIGSGLVGSRLIPDDAD